MEPERTYLLELMKGSKMVGQARVVAKTLSEAVSRVSEDRHYVGCTVLMNDCSDRQSNSR